MDTNTIKNSEQLSASAALSDDNLNAPWSLHFDRDGTEDVAVICDASGEDLLYSRHFWLPEGDDPIPPTLAAMRLMVAAPKMLDSLRMAANYMADDLDESDETEMRVFAAIRAAITEATAVGQDGGRP